MTQITLDEWVSQFRLQAKSRALWMAIRWEFEEQPPPMTVRQMFYLMSARGVVPKDETTGYRRVQRALTAMRQQGAIPYGWLADNLRIVRKPRTYTGLADMLNQSQQFYRRALWAEQPAHVEIWLEKDALAGVISPVTSEYDAPLFVTRGYPSLSYLYEAAESLRNIDKPIFVYHFGDYDASGKDAARSIREGLQAFGAEFHFEEVAVTKEQITTLNLQTRPAKKSDPRAKRWGDVAVELDAIPPATLRALVENAIVQHIEPDEWEWLKKIEAEEKATLAALIGNFGTSTGMRG